MHDETETGAAGDGPLELKPVKIGFYAKRVVPAAIFFFVFATGGSIAAFFLIEPPVWLLGPVGFVLLTAFAWYATSVAYGKERYRLLPEGRLFCARGGLLSDEETELDIRNVTHVKLRLPWLRHKFFKIGDVMIESAGSEASEITLRSIVRPEDVYERVQELMRRSGFALRQEELLHEESPDPLGVAIECGGLALSAFFGVIGLGAEIGFETVASSSSIPWIGLLIGVPLLTIVPTWLLIRFLDLRRRTYRVFDDAVVYEEGFLTRDNAFIPAENIADSNTKQNLLDQILGLHDVQVSCQGAGQEIKFRRLKRGVALSGAIDRVVESFRDRPRPTSTRTGIPGGPGGPGEPGGPVEQVHVGAPTVPVDEAWTAELRMSMSRALISLFVGAVVLCPIAPFLIFALIERVIRVMATSYQVRASSIKSRYKFLNVVEREFQYEKVTGVVVSEGPFDRWLGTLTVTFWSIGASQPLVLQHVRRDEVDLPALLRQVGIVKGEHEDDDAPEDVRDPMPARFSIGAWLKASFVGWILLGTLFVASVVAGLFLPPLWLFAVMILTIPAMSLAWSIVFYGRMRASFGPTHVEQEQGIFWKKRFHARYENIKKVILTRYPWSSVGSIEFRVAGEQKAGGQNKPGEEASSGGMAVPYGFTTRYVEGLEDKAVRIDELIARQPGPAGMVLEPGAAARRPEPSLASKPAVANSVAGLILLSVIIFPLLPLLPFTLPLTIIAVRRRRYLIEPERVVVESGIFYRAHESVLYDRIDSLKRAQGAFGKLFGNGNVTLFTAGSSKPDLQIQDAPDFPAIYEAIQARYGR